MTALRFFLLVAASSYFCIVLYMYLQQRSLQYFPGKTGLSPSASGLSAVSEQTIATPDGERIAAWYSAPLRGMPTVLFFHGNGGEISDRAERLAFYQTHGFGALFVSYRGYGRSSGTISEKGFITDALAAHGWLLERGVAAGQIAVVGESLGTGVAVQLAAQREIGALALEAPFTAAADIAASIYWWLPVRFLMKDTFHSRNHIAQIHAPVLIQHGDADEVIPVGHGRRLFEMANEPKQLVILPGEGHGIIASPVVWEREVAFFGDALKRQQPGGGTKLAYSLSISSAKRIEVKSPY